MDKMNVKEAAELLGVHINTIYNYISTGAIEANKENGSWFIPENEVLKIKRQQIISPKLVIDSTNILLNVVESKLKVKEEEIELLKGITKFKAYEDYLELENVYKILIDIKSEWYGKINDSEVDFNEELILKSKLDEESVISLYEKFWVNKKPQE